MNLNDIITYLQQRSRLDKNLSGRKEVPPTIAISDLATHFKTNRGNIDHILQDLAAHGKLYIQGGTISLSQTEYDALKDDFMPINKTTFEDIVAFNNQTLMNHVLQEMEHRINHGTIMIIERRYVNAAPQTDQAIKTPAQFVPFRNHWLSLFN